MLNTAMRFSAKGRAIRLWRSARAACGGGGRPRQLCYDAVAAAVEGTARLIQSGKHPAALKDEVCSPAGTTIEGLVALENGGFRGALMQAIAACIAKARG